MYAPLTFEPGSPPGSSRGKLGLAFTGVESDII